MKVLIATGIYPPSIGGPATYSKTLFEQLPQRGIKVIVVSFDAVRTLPKIIRHIVYMYKVWRASWDCDVIYAQDPVSVGFPAKIVSLLSRKRFMLKIVGDYAWEQGVSRYGVKDTLDDFQHTYPRTGYMVRILRAIESWVARHADRIVVPSMYLKGIVVKWGVDSQNITVVYNAHEPVHGTLNRERARAERGLSGSVIVTAGRLVPWKGFHAVIDAVAILIEKGKPVSLYIVGDGPLYPELQNYIAQKKLEASIRLLGKQKQNILFEYISGADAFVLNTSYEGLSHQLLEVMEIGTPIATTPIGGNPELIEHGVHGILFEVNNVEQIVTALLDVLERDDQTRRYVTAARAKVAQFSVDRMVTGLIDVLNEVTTTLKR